jgi:hypothetical protein
MDKATLDRAIEILEKDPSFYLPVRDLWLALREQGLARDLELEPFYTFLAGDDQFEIMEQEGGDPTSLSGARVKLASRQVTTDDVLEGLSQSLLALNQALRNAWETRPQGDEQTEGLLLDALSIAEELGREVKEVIKEQDAESDQDEGGAGK